MHTDSAALFSSPPLFSQREWLSWFLLSPIVWQVSWKCSFPGASALCHLFALRVYRGRYCLGLWVSADLLFIQKRPGCQYQMLSNCWLSRLLLWEIAEQIKMKHWRPYVCSLVWYVNASFRLWWYRYRKTYRHMVYCSHKATDAWDLVISNVTSIQLCVTCIVIILWNDY